MTIEFVKAAASRLCVTTALAMSFAGFPNLVLASGNAAAGEAKSATCVACHGQDGLGMADEFPVLAGQWASYLEQALKQYKSGARKNAIMAGFAAALSEQDIKDLAAYYAAMPSPLGTPKP